MLARQAGLTPKAVRHYDRIGLLKPEVVDGSGYRRYSATQVEASRQVARLRRLDLPLDEVRRYMTDHSTLAAHRLRNAGRGHALAGDAEQARAYTEQALATAEDITEEDHWQIDGVRGPSAPKSQYAAPLLTSEFALDVVAGV